MNAEYSIDTIILYYNSSWTYRIAVKRLANVTCAMQRIVVGRRHCGTQVEILLVNVLNSDNFFYFTHQTIYANLILHESSHIQNPNFVAA